jgi:hypothetical protein
MASPAVPLAAAMSSCCCASETPLLNVTMYGAGAGAGAEVVSVEEDDVSVELEGVWVEVSVEEVSDEGVELVSAVEASLEAAVSVPVVPTTENVSPNAPEAISPNVKRTASPTPIRRDRFRSVRLAFSVPCRALSLIPLAASLS